MYTYMYRSYSVEYQVQVKCTTTVVHVCVHTCTGTLPVCTGILCTVHTQVLVGTLHTYLCTFMYPVPAVFYGSTGLGVYTSVYVSLYMHGSTPQRPHLGLWHITSPSHGSSYPLRAWLAVCLSKRSPVEPGLKDVLCPFLWMQWR